MIQIEKFNETYNKVHCSDDIARELNDYFTFEVPGARFIPSVKAKKWDGKIRLFNSGTHHIYAGLIEYVEDFAKQNNYPHERISDFTDDVIDNVSDIVSGFDLTKEPRDYQLAAFAHAIRKRRSLLLSPTASGKSLIIYMLCRYFNVKTLLIVPTTSLVHQMYSDFEDYGFNSKENCHMIFSGQEKDNDKQIFISTWQSIFKLPKKWFDQFDCVIGDECLHPDSLISMADGTTKSLKNIVVGDEVITFDEVLKTLTSNRVNRVHHNLSVNEQMFEVRMSNGDMVKITGNHKVLLLSGLWKRVDQLKIGDVINTL